MKFENVYWDWRIMQRDQRYPSILAIGDSWFWYPFPGGSLLNRLGRLVAPRGHDVLAIGANGAEAYQFANGTLEKRVREALRLHGNSLMAVFVSGGGNDFGGFNDLRPLLKLDCSNATTAAACFRQSSKPDTLNWLLDKMMASYRALVARIIISTHPSTHIVLHNYDYARPTGKGVLGTDDWLKSALDDAQVPAHLYNDCMKYVINRFSDALLSIVAIDPRRIHLVDSRGTLRAKDWANELHPRPRGFKKIARERWQPVLQSAGLA